MIQPSLVLLAVQAAFPEAVVGAVRARCTRRLYRAQLVALVVTAALVELESGVGDDYYPNPNP
jgi:hypothetical protein